MTVEDVDLPELSGDGDVPKRDRTILAARSQEPAVGGECERADGAQSGPGPRPRPTATAGAVPARSPPIRLRSTAGRKPELASKGEILAGVAGVTPRIKIMPPSPPTARSSPRAVSATGCSWSSATSEWREGPCSVLTSLPVSTSQISVEPSSKAATSLCVSAKAIAPIAPSRVSSVAIGAPVLSIPDADRAIGAGRGKGLAIDRESQGQDRFRMPREGMGRRAGREVPEQHLVVQVGRGQRLAVGREAHSPDLVLVPDQALPLAMGEAPPVVPFEAA